MATLPNSGDSSSLEPEPFAPRTPHLIGRGKLFNAICEAIADKAGQSHVLYFVGPGGIGKTRLLEEVEAIHKERTGTPFLWTGIIDLYHTDYHSPSGLRRAITDRLDPDNRYFQEYRRLREEYEQKRQEGGYVREMEELRRRLDTQFRTDYEALAEEHRLVLCFDTLELIQHEGDTVQDICQVEDIDMAVKTWLLGQVGCFSNTVTLFAGRLNPRVEHDFEQSFTRAGCIFSSFELHAFTEGETERYLEAMSEQRPELTKTLTPQIRNGISHITQGRPIYLALIIDLLLHGETLSQIFPVSHDATPEVDEEEVGRQLVEHLLNLPDPFGQLVYFLVYARKGLDADLLQYLAGDLWSEAQTRENLARMREFAFVKVRPQTGQLFLHDEVYDFFDRYFRGDPRFGPELVAPIAQYYRQRREAATLKQEREDLTIALLYYELQVNAYAGYYRHYARWDDEAIKGHETGFDMRLRDEVLRFLNRYTDPASSFHDPRVAARLERSGVDRDGAVRWVKRHVGTAGFIKAAEIARRLRYSDHPAFDWETVDDPLYKADLLTTWGETMLYTGAPEAGTRSILEQAIEVLENGREWDEAQHWRRVRVLGRAYNNMGFLHTGAYRLGTAVAYYTTAIHFNRQADIRDQMADSLNNEAYVYARLGDISRAEKLIEDALNLRCSLGQRYLVALSLNTRGAIHLLAGERHQARALCREALAIFEELDDTRGIGLSSHTLGQAYRALGNLWRRGVYSPGEAFEFYEQSHKVLQRAINIFTNQVLERGRLVRVMHEWGALERDRGLLFKHVEEERQAAEHLNQALELLEQTIDIAGDRWVVERADCLEDVADIHVIREQFDEAENILKRAEQLVPAEYHLIPKKGFAEVEEPVEEFWAIMGKLQLQWAHIALAPIAGLATLADPQEEELLLRGMTHYAQAIAYFLQFSQELRWHKEAFERIYNHLKIYGIQRLQKVRNRVEEVEREYHVSLTPLLKEIDETLALKPQLVS